MIDSIRETVISLPEAAAHVPPRRSGKKCNTSTLYRWAKRGCQGIKLETIQVGCTCCTSLEALQRFFERLTAARDGQAHSPRTTRQREQATKKAETELSAAGW